MELLIIAAFAAKGIVLAGAVFFFFGKRYLIGAGLLMGWVAITTAIFIHAARPTKQCRVMSAAIYGKNTVARVCEVTQGDVTTCEVSTLTKVGDWRHLQSIPGSCKLLHTPKYVPNKPKPKKKDLTDV